MRQRYLEVSYRQGRIMAAYLYLPRREGDRSVRVDSFGDAYFVDRATDGRPIGIEMPSPSLVTLEGINQVLERLALEPAAPEELAPIVAA